MIKTPITKPQENLELQLDNLFTIVLNYGTVYIFMTFFIKLYCHNQEHKEKNPLYTLTVCKLILHDQGYINMQDNSFLIKTEKEVHLLFSTALIKFSNSDC